MAYLERQARGFRELERRLNCKGQVEHACIQHDHWCDLLKGTGIDCTCDPDILLIAHDGRKFELDALGKLIPPRKHVMEQHERGYCGFTTTH